ncbi:MAG TPA: Jag N-terminal domain-containing protein, partial [Ktedonobacterales bacterium]|nr:Jag N-terminal domain-containing protein [Ktedonobacterales bacterium]
MESVEASGKSIEDAIINALARLGRNRDEVEITVLQRPARGSRDASAREARVRATVLQQRPATAPETADPYFADDFEEFADDFAPGDRPPDSGGDTDFPPVEELDQPEVTTDALSDVMAEDAGMEDIAVAALYT